MGRQRFRLEMNWEAGISGGNEWGGKDLSWKWMGRQGSQLEMNGEAGSIGENPWKLMKNRWKSLKIDENQWKSMKIDENSWKSMKSMMMMMMIVVVIIIVVVVVDGDDDAWLIGCGGRRRRSRRRRKRSFQILYITTPDRPPLRLLLVFYVHPGSTIVHLVPKTEKSARPETIHQKLGSISISFCKYLKPMWLLFPR